MTGAPASPVAVIRWLASLSNSSPEFFGATPPWSNAWPQGRLDRTLRWSASS